jgi:gliding motility-associated-like protein
LYFYAISKLLPMKRIPLLLWCLAAFFAHAQTITTVAGTGGGGYSGDGGPATAATFDRPIGFTIDNSCNFYISDFNNHCIRKIDPSGIVSTICNITTTSGYSGDGGPALTAEISSSEKITVDAAGNIYFADFYNNCVRKINTAGIINTIAGNGSAGYSGDGGPATNAQLWLPSGVAVDASGNVYISDEWNNRIRKVNTAGIITTIAGNGPTGYLLGGYSGDGGLATAAAINFPVGITVTAGGDVVFADGGNHRVRKINTVGIITTVAGNGVSGYSGDGGLATLAQMQTPEGVAVDAAGVIYICDAPGHRVRKVDASGIITTLAGNGTPGFSGDGGPAAAATINYPEGVFVDPVSSCLFICDAYNNRIRRIGDCTGYACAPALLVCDSVALPDTLHLCAGDTITMPATLSGSNPIYSVAWSPASGLSSSSTLNPLLTFTTPGWHHVSVTSIIPDERITNGNFSAGATGFSTGYTLGYPSTSSSTPGNYAVNTNPYAYDPAWPVMGDHTTGAGNMLIIDGAYSSSSNFWCQTVSVTPYTDYIFTVWIALLHTPLPSITLSINGTGITTFIPLSTSGVWQQYQVIWNSGASVSANICMNDLMTGGYGNDFAIDDISLKPLCITSDSVYAANSISGTFYNHFDTAICALSMPATLHAPAGYSSVTWSTGASSPTISVAGAGTYWVQGTTSCSLRTDTFHVAITPYTSITASHNTSLCSGSSVTLTAPVSYINHYWNTGVNSASISVNAAGNYWVTDTNTLACSLKLDTFLVSVTPLSVIATSHDTAICPGAPAILTAPATFINHSWSTGETTASISINSTGTYWVSDTNSSLCILRIDSVHVGSLPVPTVSLGSDTAICAGQSIVLSSPLSSGSYLWNTGNTSPSITVAAAGVYILTVMQNLCKASDSILITMISVPTVDLGPDTVLCAGESFIISTGNPATVWSNGSVGRQITITETGVYWAQITNACGSTRDEVTVNIGSCSVGVPGAFSPNGDGENDVLYVRGEGLARIDFKIYNRWGQVVFSTINKNVGWTGKFNGEEQPIEIYGYVLNVTFIDGSTKTLKGNVSLLR